MNVISHAGHTIQAMQASDGTWLWRSRVETPLVGTPAVGDGVLYASTRDGSVLALRIEDGSLLWRYDSATEPLLRGSALVSSPVVARGAVYIAPAANSPFHPYLCALRTSTGKLLWQIQLPESTSQELVILDDVIYISASSMCCVRLASDGSNLWSRKILEHGSILSRPVVADRELYMSSLQVFPFSRRRHLDTKPKQIQLHALRRDDGTPLWNTQLPVAEPTDSGFVTEPVVTQTSIFLGTDDGSLFALNRNDGTLRWRYQTNGTRLSVPVVSQNVVFIGVNDGSVLALNVDDGTLLWRTPLNGKKITVAAILSKRPQPPSS